MTREDLIEAILLEYNRTTPRETVQWDRSNLRRVKNYKKHLSSRGVDPSNVHGMNPTDFKAAVEELMKRTKK